MTVGRRSSRRLRLCRPNVRSAVTVRLAASQWSVATERATWTAHTWRPEGPTRIRAGPYSNRQPREVNELPGTTSGWSPPVQKNRDTSGKDPKGGVPRKREALAAQSAAAAARGGREGGTHVYPRWGTVERCLQRGAEMHGQDRRGVLFLCEKKAKLGSLSALLMGRARTISTRKHKHNLCLRPGLT